MTGGASGIGAAVVRQLAAKGAKVIIADLNAEKGGELAKEIDGKFVAVDVTKTEDLENAVNQATELGPLRVLVNSAGIGWAQRTIGKDGDFASAHNLDAYKKVIAINLIGTFDAIRLAATAMSRNEPLESNERGAIVNMASVAAFDGQIGQASYSSSKGGVVGMTLPVARDLAAVGVRVNTVAPGLIDTPIYGEGEAAEAFKAKLGESVLFPRRLGVPDELASMVVELVTNSYMNAEVVRVDGASGCHRSSSGTSPLTVTAASDPRVRRGRGGSRGISGAHDHLERLGFCRTGEHVVASMISPSPNRWLMNGSGSIRRCATNFRSVPRVLVFTRPIDITMLEIQRSWMGSSTGLPCTPTLATWPAGRTMSRHIWNVSGMPTASIATSTPSPSVIARISSRQPDEVDTTPSVAPNRRACSTRLRRYRNCL